MKKIDKLYIITYILTCNFPVKSCALTKKEMRNFKIKFTFI